MRTSGRFTGLISSSFITLCKVTQCSADILLDGSGLIGDSGIKEIYTKLKPTLYDLTGMFFVDLHEC